MWRGIVKFALDFVISAEKGRVHVLRRNVSIIQNLFSWQKMQTLTKSLLALLFWRNSVCSLVCREKETKRRKDVNKIRWSPFKKINFPTNFRPPSSRMVCNFLPVLLERRENIQPQQLLIFQIFTANLNEINRRKNYTYHRKVWRISRIFTASCFTIICLTSNNLSVKIVMNCNSYNFVVTPFYRLCILSAKFLNKILN